MVGYVKKLFKRGNILILIMLAGAFLGTLGILQYFGIESEYVILGLLGVLALDTIIERLGYLDRIEQRLNSIDDKIEPKSSADEFFQSRKLMSNFELELQAGHQFWLYGRSLTGLLAIYYGQIEEAANQGKRFRIVIVNYQNPIITDAIGLTSKAFPSGQAVERLGMEAAKQLEQLIKDTPEGTIVVKLADHVPDYSLRIVDGEEPFGRMLVEQYGYKIASGDRLHVNLSMIKDPGTYSFYLDQFNRVWEKAIALQA